MKTCSPSFALINNNFWMLVSSGCTRIEEGSESAEFMKACFDESKKTPEPGKRKSPPARAFLVTGSSGIVVVEEIIKFTQDDLDNDHVVILDGFNHLFIWFGDKATSTEKELALDTAQVSA